MAGGRLAVLITEAIIRPADRLARLRSHYPVAYAVALISAGVAIVLAEVYLADFEHGTHLLLLLIVVIGTALIWGPGPAAIGLVVGGAVSAVASVGTAEPATHPNIVVQLVTYMLAGTSFIVLIAIAARSGMRMPLATRPAPKVSPGPPYPSDSLTAREQEVLRLAATGVSVEEIGRLLFLSPNTVKTHLTHTYAKLGARGRSQAIRSALHFGYLTTADICPHLREEDPDGESTAGEHPDERTSADVPGVGRH